MERSSLLNSHSVLSEMLPQMDISLERKEAMIMSLSSFSHEVANSSPDNHLKPLSMVVVIKLTQLRLCNDDDNEMDE